jgi:hypothetical protein
MKGIVSIVFIITLVFSTDLISQKEDYIWLFGLSDIDITEDSLWGSSNIDFNYDPPKVYYVPDRISDFQETNTSLCDEYGDILCYTNGMFICNGDNDIIENGDSITYGPFWEYWNLEFPDGNYYKFGLPIRTGAIFLPVPNNKDQILLFHEDVDIETWTVDKVYVTNINISDNKSEVIFKDSLLIEDTLSSGKMMACRHANGRDWWLLKTVTDHDEFYTFLIDSEGVHMVTKQKIGSFSGRGIGQSVFSPDGSMFAMINGHKEGWDGIKIQLYDFDRSTGLLSNYREDVLNNGFLEVPAGIAFSPDGNLLYACNKRNVYQYDLNSIDFVLSKQVVAEYDGYEHVYTNSGYPTYFGSMRLGADGRIYIVPCSAANREMHRIEYPNDRGEDCMVNQHCIQMASFSRTIPNIANYRLGPLDGSPADTLGLDNHPIAEYRYEQDTLDHHTVRFTDLSYFRPESWYWTFGDGNTTNEQYPYHSYDKNGVYEVCLTVSNENSSNTSCRTLTIGTSAAVDITDQIELSIYPNPFVDQVLVTLGEYIPQDGYFVVYDISGKEVQEARIYYGWNNVNLSHLTSGTYVYELRDGGVLLKSGKLLK